MQRIPSPSPVWDAEGEGASMSRETGNDATSAGRRWQGPAGKPFVAFAAVGGITGLLVLLGWTSWADLAGQMLADLVVLVGTAAVVGARARR